MHCTINVIHAAINFDFQEAVTTVLCSKTLNATRKFCHVLPTEPRSKEIYCTWSGKKREFERNIILYRQGIHPDRRIGINFEGRA